MSLVADVLYDNVLGAPDRETRKEALDKLCAEKVAEGMPRALTAENGAKAAMIGEFWVDYEYTNEDGEEHTIKVMVPWTTIKEIYEMAVEMEKSDEI